jgi:hypothetical protein
MTELWWHAFQHECDCGVVSTVLLGESTVHPEQLPLLTADELWLKVCLSCSLAGEMRYVRSWNHEPTADELDRAGLGLEWA